MFEGYTTPTKILFFILLAGIVFFATKIYMTEIYVPEKVNCALKNSEKIYEARRICPEKARYGFDCNKKAFEYVCEHLPREK